MVIATWARTPDAELLPADRFREKREAVDFEGIIPRQKIKWRPTFQAIEKSLQTLPTIQNARRRGAPFRALDANRDKVIRSIYVRIQYENGMIYHQRGAHMVGGVRIRVDGP